MCADRPEGLAIPAVRSGRFIVAAPRLVLLTILFPKKLTIASFSARIGTLRLCGGPSFRLSTNESECDTLIGASERNPSEQQFDCQ